MDGSNIGGMPNPNAQWDFLPAQAPTTTPPAPGQVQYNPSISTIDSSDQQLIEQLFLSMGVPMLLPPNMSLDAGNNSQAISAAAGAAALMKIGMMVDEKKHEIISSMWEKFNESMKELEEISKKDYIQKWVTEVGKDGPKSGAEYFAYLLALSPSRREKELSENGDHGQAALGVQFNALFNQWFSVPKDDSITAKDGLDPSFKVGALAANSHVVHEAVTVVGLAALGGELSVSPLADALLAVGPNTGLPMDAQAAAAMIAALLYGGARDQTNLEIIKKMAVTSQPPQDMDFALNFARNILAIVSHDVEGGGASGKEGAGQNQMIRLMLSVMALNLLYRAGFGGMEGSKEFVDLLKDGGTDGLDPSIKPTIDRLIAQIKRFLPANEPDRSRVLASLSEYIDSKDSVESMLSTSRMFAASLKAGPNIFGGRLGAVSA